MCFSPAVYPFLIDDDDTGREWELLNAFEDNREPGGAVYQFEYRVQVRKRK